MPRIPRQRPLRPRHQLPTLERRQRWRRHAALVAGGVGVGALAGAVAASAAGELSLAFPLVSLSLALTVLALVLMPRP